MSGGLKPGGATTPGGVSIALAALGAYTRTDDVFTATAWTIVAPASGNAGTSVASFQTGNVGRIVVGSTGAMGGLTGPRIERALSLDVGKRWRLRVTPQAIAFTSGTPNGALFVRNSAADDWFLMSLRATTSPGNMYALDSSGGAVIGGPTASIAWDGTSALEMRYENGSITFGGIAPSGLFVPVPVNAVDAVLSFVPSHVGICGQTGEASSGRCDFTAPIFEVLP